MVKNYKRKIGARPYINYDEDQLQRAIDERMREGTSYKDLEKEYGIPAATIFRKVKNLHTKTPGGQTHLSKEDESAIEEAILIAAEWGYPFEPEDVKSFVQSYLNRMGRRIPIFTENKPGEQWYKNFLKRHPRLSTRFSQCIKASRAEISPGIINKYFDKLEVNLNDIQPEGIVNYDETNFCDDPGRSKIIVRRGSKRAEKIMDTSKSATSVMFAVSASGVMLPPYIVYKADHIWQTWTERGPDGARYNRSKSGWFDQNLFEDWFLTIAMDYFKKLPSGPKVLIGDNLASHLSLKVITECQANDIKFILLPPNSTHLCQPLDVSCFKPIKVAWRHVLKAWKRSHKGVIRKDIFPNLLRQTIEKVKASSVENIKSGFRTTGLVPLDRTKILNKLPKLIEPEHANLNAVNVLKDILTETRYKKADTIVRRKKINVEPGQSVTASDIMPSTSKEKEKTNGPRRKRKLAKENIPENEISDDDAVMTIAKATVERRALKRIENDREINSENEDIESYSDIELIEEEIREAEEASEENDDIEEMSVKEIAKGDFVIVELKTAKGISRKFVAKVLEVLEDDTFECSFLRPSTKIQNVYFFPQVPDESLVSKNEIEKVLPTPEMMRRGGFLFKNISH